MFRKIISPTPGKPSSLYISQKSLKVGGQVSCAKLTDFAKMVGFAIALPTLHNTLYLKFLIINELQRLPIE
jgi:hypothetical protein